MCTFVRNLYVHDLKVTMMMVMMTDILQRVPSSPPGRPVFTWQFTTPSVGFSPDCTWLCMGFINNSVWFRNHTLLRSCGPWEKWKGFDAIKQQWYKSNTSTMRNVWFGGLLDNFLLIFRVQVNLQLPFMFSTTGLYWSRFSRRDRISYF